MSNQYVLYNAGNVNIKISVSSKTCKSYVNKKEKKKITKKDFPFLLIILHNFTHPIAVVLCSKLNKLSDWEGQEPNYNFCLLVNSLLQALHTLLPTPQPPLTHVWMFDPE